MNVKKEKKTTKLIKSPKKQSSCLYHQDKLSEKMVLVIMIKINLYNAITTVLHHILIFLVIKLMSTVIW